MSRTWPAVGLIAGAVFYRPLVFWAENAWDLAAPEDVFFIAGAAFVVGLIPFWALKLAGLRVLPVGLCVAGVIFTLFHFHTTPWLSGGIWIGIVAALGVVAYLLLSDLTLSRLLVVALVLLILAPVLQVAIQHVTHRHPYPLANVADSVQAEPSGAVEDVLVVIVDSYPMLAVAEQWFGYDPSLLEESLLEADFKIERVSWSHNTFTGLAVPSILQLEQIADASAKGAWGNRRASYEIIGGSNFVAGTLKNAGFEYTHIESGWNGGKCRQVDVCLESTWLDEAAWNLLRHSVLGDSLISQHGSMEVPNTRRAIEHLTALDLFGDGHRDYVYAHLMLPHAPYVVDETCSVLSEAERADAHDDYLPIRRQLACVDSLLIEIAERADATTAVMIAGDHGTRVGTRAGTASDEWNDADIAEQLGALLAYKLPDGCEEPAAPTNVYAMRAIIECAVDADLPSLPARFLLGADEPIWVEADRLATIGLLLESGELEGPG